jgi:hypothetical protein
MILRYFQSKKPLKVIILEDPPKHKYAKLLLPIWRTIRNYVLPILQASLTAFAIILSYESFQLARENFKSAEDGRTASKQFINDIELQLATLNTSFSDLNKAVVKLPNTIQFLDSSVQTMRTHIESLKEVVTKFDSTLTGLSNVSNKQILLIKETQKQWATELSKKPLIKLTLISIQRDSLNKLTIFPQFSNYGDKYSKEFSAVLSVPPDYDFHSSGWASYPSGKRPNNWSISTSGPIGAKNDQQVFSMRPNGIDFTINIPNNFKNKFIKLYYYISSEYPQNGDSLIIQIIPPDSTIYFHN